MSSSCRSTQADLASVRAAAERAAAEPRLDVLVNNAGIMGAPRTLTVDGFEAQFAVNHLGTFALTARLLPKLEETEGQPGRRHRQPRPPRRPGSTGKTSTAQRSTRVRPVTQQSKLANLLVHGRARPAG